MTEEHVIPDWFFKRLREFGIKVPPLKNEIHLLCAKCNGSKGGKLDFASVATRDLIKQIVLIWVPEIRKHENFDINP